MATAYETFTLEGLLGIAQRRFGDTGGHCYEFTLGRIGCRWRLDIVNFWQKWRDRGFDIHFEGDTPSAAVVAFLTYVDDNRISVRSLTEAGALAPARAVKAAHRKAVG